MNIATLIVAGALAVLAVQQHPRAAPSLCSSSCPAGSAQAFSLSPSAASARARAEVESQRATAPAPGSGTDVPVGAKIGVPVTVAGSGARRSASAGTRQQVPHSSVQPDTLVIPATGVDAPVDEIGISNGELVIPSDVSRVGSWTGGPAIGSATGSTLVAGHIDNIDQGAGAFKTLTQMQAGDLVYLNQRGLITRWVTTALLEVSKPDLPQSLFVGPTGPRLLHLVSCAGQIHNGSYDDNIIVTLVPFQPN